MRLFVAAWPPPEVVRTLAALPRPEVPGVRWTTADQWHVTLRFLGSIAEADLPALEAALAAGLAEPAGGAPAVGPAACRMGPATGCFSRAVLMVPVSGLEAAAAATVAATAGFGEAPPDRPFAGHLTLARSRGPDLRRLAGQPVAAAWTSSEVTLVRSHTDRSGARYEVLRRFPLSA